MEEKQKEMVEALEVYRSLQQGVYKKRKDGFRWLELKMCHQGEISKLTGFSPSVISKAISESKASFQVEAALDKIVYQVRLARLALCTPPGVNKFMDLEGKANA